MSSQSHKIAIEVQKRPRTLCATEGPGAPNQLTRIHDKDGWTYFDYDGNGNTVKEQTPSWTRYYDWDGRDMLTGVAGTVSL